MNPRDEMAMYQLQEKIARAMAHLEATAAEADCCPTCAGTGWYLGEPCPDCRCPVCGGIGYVRPDVGPEHDLFGQMVPCPANCTAIREIQEHRRGAIRKYSALPAEYADLTFESFDALDARAREGKGMARRAVGAWVEQMHTGGWIGNAGDLRNWIALHGVHGRGKTGLAASAVNALTDAGQPCLYIRLQDFIEAVQRRYAKGRQHEDDFGSDSAEDVIETVKAAPVLIMDEFDVPDLRENKLAIVEKIIRSRHGQRLPTLITTNLNPEQFQSRWGDTIASVTLARTHWILMDGPSLRRDATKWHDR